MQRHGLSNTHDHFGIGRKLGPGELAGFDGKIGAGFFAKTLSDQYIVLDAKAEAKRRIELTAEAKRDAEVALAVIDLLGTYVAGTAQVVANAQNGVYFGREIGHQGHRRTHAHQRFRFTSGDRSRCRNPGIGAQVRHNADWLAF